MQTSAPSTLEFFTLPHPVICEQCWHVNVPITKFVPNFHYFCGKDGCGAELTFVESRSDPLYFGRHNRSYCEAIHPSTFYDELNKYIVANKNDLIANDDELLNNNERYIFLEMMSGWAQLLKTAVEDNTIHLDRTKIALYHSLYISTVYYKNKFLT